MNEFPITSVSTLSTSKGQRLQQRSAEQIVTSAGALAHSPVVGQTDAIAGALAWLSGKPAQSAQVAPQAPVPGPVVELWERRTASLALHAAPVSVSLAVRRRRL